MAISATRTTRLTSRQEYCDCKFFELLGKPGTQFEYDLAHIARDAMTKGAQLRMTNASFPQELRLQVMKAGVRYHSSTFNISSSPLCITSLLGDIATSLFDTQHTVGAVYDLLRKLAEQAFFEATIFKVQTDISFSRAKDGKMYNVIPHFEEIAEHVHHLELKVRILPILGWEATLENAASLWTSLRLSSPKLKACVLTVVVRSLHQYPVNGIHVGYYNTNDDAPFPKEILQEGPLEDECLGNTLTKLFAEFAEKGPGVRRFVRIQHLQCDRWKESATPHYGPLVAVHHARSDADARESPEGLSMLTAAYQFARTGEKTEHHFRANH